MTGAWSSGGGVVRFDLRRVALTLAAPVLALVAAVAIASLVLRGRRGPGG